MPPNTPISPFLPDERKKTDASLIVERDKTNESLAKSQQGTERQIDKSVISERADADRTTLKSRETADINRDVKRNAKNYDIRDEGQNSDDRLLEERRRADVAIDLERKRVDVAIDNERDLKNEHAGRLLDRERKITDQNLKDERFQTDTEVHRSSGRLASEVSEHLKTKTILTSREEFLAIVSHDLRNPIGAASSCAAMLLEDSAYENINPEVKYWIAFIQRNVDTSLRLIADLLDLERISQGKVIIRRAPTCLGDIVRETIETFTPAASTKSILLRVMPFDVKCEICCDGERIKQVISNLVGNAVKFTPEGGSITVSLETKTEMIQVSVSDTGPGIAQEKTTQIFERFAQIGSKDRTGLGLGLYISKMLIEAYGGKIWVESKAGEGSQFIFTIPRNG